MNTAELAHRTVQSELGPGWPVLQAYFESRSRNSLIIGPRGSGKTYTTAQRLLWQMLEQEPARNGHRLSRWFVVRSTLVELENTTIKDFLEVFKGLGTMSWSPPITFTADTLLPDGTRLYSETIFIGLDSADDQNKLRGAQATGFWFNEAGQIDQEIIAQADLSHGRYPSLAAGGVFCSWHGMMLDTNAFDTEHWLYPIAEPLAAGVEPARGWAVFKQPGGVIRVRDARGERWEANPHAENLDKLVDGIGYYGDALGGKSDEWINVYLANNYGFHADGKPVHPEYRDLTHCPQYEIPYDPRLELVVGVDFGRTPAAILLQRVPIKNLDARWHAIDELVARDMSAALFGPMLKRYIDAFYSGARVRVFGDPAGDKAGDTVEQTPIDLLKASGLPAQPAPSNQPILRRAALSNPLTRLCSDGLPGILVSTKCPVLRKALAGGFCYRRLKVMHRELYTEQPEKNEYSHPAEACEYGLLGGGEHAAALTPSVRQHRPRHSHALT